MTRKLTLLAVMAHPDDESFGPGGTLARYAAEGVNVHVIIATDGIAGSVEDDSYLSHGSLAQVRSAELANAAVALGVTSIWSLPYRDSGMKGAADNDNPLALIQQPIDQLTQEILGYIERLQPDVILTHDPYGGYGHPDHIRCCEATTAAFYVARTQASNTNGAAPAANGAAGREAGAYAGPQKLYYTAFDKFWLKIVVFTMQTMYALQLSQQNPREIGRNKDINLVEISGWKTPVHAAVDVLRYLPQKEAASEAHASQYGGGPGFMRVLPAPVRRRVQGRDTFTLAFPAPSSAGETDLFAGLR